MKNKYLTIVIPQYNELSNLKKGLLHEAFEYLMNVDFSYEVIVVDDGSDDGSLSYLRENYAKYENLNIVEAKHGGKPSAIYEGIKQAKGEYLLFTDMDQSTPLKELNKLLKYVPEYKAVIGSRGKRRNSAGVVRKLAGLIFSTFRKTFVLSYVNDTQCGFKLFETKVLAETYPKLKVLQDKDNSGWSVSAFDVELLYLIDKMGYKIKEVRVEWRDEDISDTKNRKFFRESIDMFEQVIMILWREIRGKYS